MFNFFIYMIEQMLDFGIDKNIFMFMSIVWEEKESIV